MLRYQPDAIYHTELDDKLGLEEHSAKLVYEFVQKLIYKLIDELINKLIYKLVIQINIHDALYYVKSVSYTHLTLPTKRIV